MFRGLGFQPPLAARWSAKQRPEAARPNGVRWVEVCDGGGIGERPMSRGMDSGAHARGLVSSVWRKKYWLRDPGVSHRSHSFLLRIRRSNPITATTGTAIVENSGISVTVTVMGNSLDSIEPNHSIPGKYASPLTF